MANRTVKEAHTVRGTNPQYLVEKIIRTRIYDSLYWKEQCFALSAEMVVDRAMDLRYIGGVYAGNIKPTPFLCLTLKLLQLQPEKEIVIEFIRQDEFKYVRALGALYIRLTFPSLEVYKMLEPLYNDYRKLRYMDRMGNFKVIFFDEFIDTLLREDRNCDIQLPRLQKRQALEDSDQLELYVSALDEDLEHLSDSDYSDEGGAGRTGRKKNKERPSLISKRNRSRSGSREGRRHRSHSREKPSSSSRDRDRDNKEWEKERYAGASSSTHRHRDRYEERDERERRREKERGRGGSSKQGADAKADLEREIEESNALRAKLGLAPLQR